MSDAEYLLNIFRTLNPEQFRALAFAAHHHVSIHAVGFYSPDSPAFDYTAITLLEERGLITRDQDKPGYYQLTHLGKRLMGLPTGKQLPGFEDAP
jgi:hypothetical protein